MSRSPLLSERLSAYRLSRVVVPFFALIAVVLGLLALHSLGSTHVHAADTAMSGPAVHQHTGDANHHTAGSTPSQVSDSVAVSGPGGFGASDCPSDGGMSCCATIAACVMVLALLSVSIAIGAGPVSVFGVAALSIVAAIIAFRQAPIRPPSLAQLSTFRI
jgi:hypothetical protein